VIGGSSVPGGAAMSPSLARSTVRLVSGSDGSYRYHRWGEWNILVAP
jgi:hypothetical protein